MNVADALIRMLADCGVEYIFGVPGDTNVPLYHAIRDAGGRVRHVMARDERSASYMAESYARLTGKPGVCECPSGAGVLYSMPGAAEAFCSSVPFILLVNDIPLAGEGRGTLTELDCVRLLEPITKLSVQVKLPQKLPDAVRRAFRAATSGRPGAAQVVLPEDVMLQPMPDGADTRVERDCLRAPAYPARGDGASTARLAAMFGEAERPVIVAGGGANRSEARAAILAVAERFGAPVVTTITGQSVVPDDHPLALGVVGDNGYHPHAHRAVEESDLLVYVGSRVGSVITMGWTFPAPSPARRIVQIDCDPEMLANAAGTALSIAGDARCVMEDVLEAAAEGTAQRTKGWVDSLNRDRAAFWSAMAADLESDSVPLKPQRVIAELNRRLEEPVIVISDAGTPTPYASRFLCLKHAGSSLVIPRGYGGLGYAIPAVIGAWLGRPDARPIGLFGDGSLGMSAGELETLARLNVPAVLIHFNNASFGWIKALQRVQARPGENDPFVSVDFTPGDMARVASAFGLAAWRAETPDELSAALDKAFATKGPSFVDVVVESIADALPPVYRWLKKTGSDPLALPQRR